LDVARKAVPKVGILTKKNSVTAIPVTFGSIRLAYQLLMERPSNVSPRKEGGKKTLSRNSRNSF
jgi:hypothetical protein